MKPLDRQLTRKDSSKDIQFEEDFDDDFSVQRYLHQSNKSTGPKPKDLVKNPSSFIEQHTKQKEINNQPININNLQKIINGDNATDSSFEIDDDQSAFEESNTGTYDQNKKSRNSFNSNLIDPFDKNKASYSSLRSMKLLESDEKLKREKIEAIQNQRKKLRSMS